VALYVLAGFLLPHCDSDNDGLWGRRVPIAHVVVTTCSRWGVGDGGRDPGSIVRRPKPDVNTGPFVCRKHGIFGDHHDEKDAC